MSLILAKANFKQNSLYWLAKIGQLNWKAYTWLYKLHKNIYTDSGFHIISRCQFY